MLGAAALLVPIAIGLAVFGAFRPDAIPLCFNPVEKQKVVCPTQEVPAPTRSTPAWRSPTSTARGGGVRPSDMALIEIIGLIVAVVAGIVALRSVRGTSTPVSLAVALALVEVPLGP